MQSRRADPSDVSDEEWALVAPYLTVLPETAFQCEHSPREVFNGQRHVARYGVAWRAMPHDLRAVLHSVSGRSEEPPAVVLDSRTLPSTPESDARAAWDGHQRIQGSKLHAAVGTLGQVLALHVTPANADDRAAAATWADAAPMGRRTRLRLDGPFPPTGSRLRALARHPGRIASRRLQRPVLRRAADFAAVGNGL